MKNLILSLLCTLVCALWNNTSAVTPDHGTPVSSTAMASEDPETLLRIRLCANALFVSVCVELDCDLHWSDAIVPGFGQILGHKGCTPVGQVSNPNNGTSVDFNGTEDMIKKIESAMKLPTGGLKVFEVLKSPTFPVPTGTTYRIIAKTYPVLNGASGRYIPFEFERVD